VERKVAVLQQVDNAAYSLTTEQLRRKTGGRGEGSVIA